MNIFLTVGGQMPFDRLVQSVDLWAASHRHHTVFAQIGDAEYVPKSFSFSNFLDPSQFDERILWADGVIAHAGMGAILKSLQYGKPILVLPRRVAFRETRNDHQVSTAKKLAQRGMVLVAMTEEDLPECISALEQKPPPKELAKFASAELMSAIRSFITCD